MNHTIKGILTAAVITSMLVLGATSMISIMQNASARSTNANSNTNTADSSSSSDATASNTNNITNSATASQSQEQDACAVAVTCPEGSTTITPTPPTSTCNPSTVGGITATPTDGTCTATILFSAGKQALAIFGDECQRIPGGTLHGNDEISVTCTFPSTPPA
jgi:hypothetical protein